MNWQCCWDMLGKYETFRLHDWHHHKSTNLPYWKYGNKSWNNMSFGDYHVSLSKRSIVASEHSLMLGQLFVWWLLRTAGSVKYVVHHKTLYPSSEWYSSNLVASMLTLLVQNKKSNPQSDPNSLIPDHEGLGSLCDTYVAPDGRIQGVSMRDMIILLAHLFLL